MGGMNNARPAPTHHINTATVEGLPVWDETAVAEVERAARAAEREACIDVCDAVAARVTRRMSPATMDDMEYMKLSGQRIGAWDCAAMIRARAEGQSNG